MAQPDIQTQAAQAADEILRRIATLELPPGATFTERELASQLGMGKVPVREGLLRLSWTGLLEPRTGSGYTIVPITLRAVRDLFDAWKVVEPASVELALSRAIADRMVADLREVEAADDPALAEFQFHFALGLAGQNLPLHRAHPGLELTRVLKLSARLGGPAGCSPGTHEPILAAIEAHDPGAPRLVRDAIDALHHQVLEALVAAEDLQGVNLGRR